jgi:lipid-binding SYLF domain-containing protein
VFDTPAAFDSFVNKGWELGAQATAAAQYEGQGTATAGAMPVSAGVWLYQLTDDGLALELTAKGTRYYRDEELN